MSSVALLLGKDVRLLSRSRLLAAALVVYPLLIALVVGLLVRYAGERPRVALVEEGALPGIVAVGNRTFDVRGLLEQATEVRLVRMSAAEAASELDRGRTLATLVVPRGFVGRIESMKESPRIILETTRSGLATRVIEKIQALVYSLNLKLQKAYIGANLAAVDLLLRGGSAKVGSTTFTLLGLDRADRALARLARSPDPAVVSRARELRAFVKQLRGAVGQVGVFLRATANPIQLVTRTRGGRGWLLSAQIQVYALALTLAFVTTLLGAAAVAAEREDAVIGRLARGIVPVGRLLAEKVAFAAVVAGVIAFALALVFGLIVQLGGVSGGEPWARLPLLALGVLLAALAFAAFGVLLGTVAREAGTGMLLAFLLGLPLALLGAVPGDLSVARGLGDVFPFGHTSSLFSSVLYDVHPLGGLGRGAAWLVALTLVFAGLARLAARRLVV